MSLTTETNKAIIRRYIDELNQRRVAILDELVASEFRFVVRQGYERNVTAFPDYFVKIQDMVAEADQVVVEWTYRGTHQGVYRGLPPTGKTIEDHSISIYRLTDGQIVDARGIWDRAELGQQLGLIQDLPAAL